MTYRDLIETTQQSIQTYWRIPRPATPYKPWDEKKESRRKIAENLLGLTRSFYDDARLPIGISYFLDDVGEKKLIASKRYRHTLHGVYMEYFGNLYNLLKASGVWDRHGGESLKEVEVNGEKTLVSERYPNVFFSDFSAQTDIGWIPHLTPPGSMSSEMSAVLFLAGYATQDVQKSKELGIVDYLTIKLKPYERVYAEHILHLLCRIFGLPEERFNYDEDAAIRRTKYNLVYTPQIKLQSRMIGSYFQNLEGVFVPKERGAAKKLPRLDTAKRKKSFVRGATDCRGNITNRQINFLGGEEFLSFVKDAIEDLGFETSDIKPYMRKTHMLTTVKEDGKKLVCTAGMQAPVGSKVYERLGRGSYDEVGRVADHLNDDVYRKTGVSDFIVVELTRQPTHDIFQGNRHFVYLKGGASEFTRFMEEIRPKNPVKTIEFMRSLGVDAPHPDATNYQETLQERLFDANISPMAMAEFCRGRRDMSFEEIIEHFA